MCSVTVIPSPRTASAWEHTHEWVRARRVRDVREVREVTVRMGAATRDSVTNGPTRARSGATWGQDEEVMLEMQSLPDILTGGREASAGVCSLCRLRTSTMMYCTVSSANNLIGYNHSTLGRSVDQLPHADGLALALDG